MLSPAATGSTASVFVIETSAEAVTAVPSVEASFPFEGSVVVVETVAVFDSGSVRAGWTVTTSVRVAVALEAIAPTDQVTVPAASDPPPEADTNDVPAGIGSLIWTLWAVEGPLFVTVSV